MKKLIIFFKTAAAGGLLVLIPLLLLYFIISELVEAIIGLATPIAALFPDDFLGSFDEPLVVAIALLFLCSFLFGLALRSSLLIRAGTSIENATIGKLTIYQAIKRLSRGLLGADDGIAFGCGLLTSADSRQLVYIVEDNGNGLLTILVPLAPAGLNGPVFIVEETKVEKLDISMAEASVAISQWGIGLQNLIRK